MQKREILWPAQKRSIFWEDYSLMGRTPHFDQLEEHFGKIFIVYGPVRASKTASSLITWSPLSYFEPAGFSSWCFIPKILEGIMNNAISRTGLEFKGNVRYVATAEEILHHAGDRIKRDVIVVPEVMMLDSGIIDVSHELARRGKVVLLDGLDLSYRGDYFPFQDYKNGKTMADLIASIPPEQRFPRQSYCTAELNPLGDRCRRAAKFTQRKFPDDTPCPWHDELIKIRPYTERTAQGNVNSENDKYRAACAEHLAIPHHEIPAFILGIVGLTRKSNTQNVLDIASRLGQDATTVKATLERMLLEHHIEEDSAQQLYLPRRYTS